MLEADNPEFMERSPMPRDRRIFPVPDAGVVVAIDSRAKDRLAIYKANMNAALEKAEYDYFYVASRPPSVAVRGAVYKYVPAVRSNKKSWRVTVESGPKGMTAGNDGSITWAVPTDFRDATVVVILKFTTENRESFQTARIVVKGASTK
jgi:hypothetical protein